MEHTDSRSCFQVLLPSHLFFFFSPLLIMFQSSSHPLSFFPTFSSQFLPLTRARWDLLAENVLRTPTVKLTNPPPHLLSLSLFLPFFCSNHIRECVCVSPPPPPPSCQLAFNKQKGESNWLLGGGSSAGISCDLSHFLSAFCCLYQEQLNYIS